jgi:hypothetical protein
MTNHDTERLHDEPVTADTLEEKRAALAAYGYVDLAEHNGITVGTRVHHRNERYYEALHNGTATVLALMERPDSAWSQKWNQRDIELIVRRDADGRLSGWADYHTRIPRADW